MLNLIKKFLSDFKHFPNNEEFDDYLQSHPDQPSLFSITDTLEKFEIENIAIEVDKKDFASLPNNFLTIYDSDIIYTTKKELDKVHFTDQNLKKNTVNKQDFLDNWRPVVIAIEKNKAPQKNKIKPSKWPLILIPLTILFSFLFINHSIKSVNIIYFIIANLGIYISTLAIQQSLGKTSSVASKICRTGSNNHKNCSSVLNSKGGKLFNSITLSDISLIFFTTLLLFSFINIDTTLLFKIIALSTIPVIFYSVIYQKVKLNSWCGLCLIIISILIIFNITALSQPHNNTPPLTLPLILFGTIFLITTLTWLTLEPIIKGYFKLKEENSNLKSFKRNPNIFKHLQKQTLNELSEKHKYPPLMKLGKETSKHKLQLFLSPSCQFCHEAFIEGYRLYKKHKDSILFEVGFNLNLTNTKNPYNMIAKIILEQQRQNGNEIAFELLNDWHNQTVTLEKFVEKNKLPISNQALETGIQQQKWCISQNFNFAPVRILNSNLIPIDYSLKEISLFINKL